MGAGEEGSWRESKRKLGKGRKGTLEVREGERKVRGAGMEGAGREDKWRRMEKSLKNERNKRGGELDGS